MAWWGFFAGASLLLFTGIGLLLLVFTLSHLAVVGLLHPPDMRVQYEGQQEWRERWQIGDRDVARIGGLVTNVGTLLPFAAFYAFFPRDGALLATAAVVLAAFGTAALVRMRTWGLLALATSGGLLVASASAGCPGYGAAIVGGLLVLAVMRFAPDVVRWFRTV